MMNMKKENSKLHIIGGISKPKVMLVHGAGFYWETCFSRIIDDLKDRYCILIPELEGHTHNPEEYMVSVEATANNIAKELLKKDIHAIDVVYGVSLGASVAVEITINCRINIGNLILDGGQYESMGEMTEQYSNFMADAFLKLLEGENLASPVKENMGYSSGNDVEVLQPLIYKQITRKALLQAFLAAFSYDLKSKQIKIDSHVAVIIGGNEAYAEQCMPLLEEICLLSPKIFEYPNRGHAEVLSKDPEKIAELILCFSKKDMKL